MNIDANKIIEFFMVILPFMTGIIFGIINIGLFKKEYSIKEWSLLVMALFIINYVIYVHL